VEIKLTKKPLAAVAPPPPPVTPLSGAVSAANARPAPATAVPFLEVSAQGGDVNVVHGVPLLGEPLRRSAVDAAERLVQSGGGDAVPYWLELTPQLAQQLWQEVSSLKAVGPTLDLATMPSGDLHLYAETHALTLGTEHRGLTVFFSPGYVPHGGASAQPASAAQRAAAAAATTPGGRLAAARMQSPADVSEVHLSARDLLLALSFHSTRCDALLLGVAAHGGYVEVACRFDDPALVKPDAVALGIRLPVKEPTVT
jgi:hypothetical protein